MRWAYEGFELSPQCATNRSQASRRPNQEYRDQGGRRQAGAATSGTPSGGQRRCGVCTKTEASLSLTTLRRPLKMRGLIDSMRHRPILAPSLLRSHSPGVVALRSPHPGCLIPVVPRWIIRAGVPRRPSRPGYPATSGVVPILARPKSRPGPSRSVSSAATSAAAGAAFARCSMMASLLRSATRSAAGAIRGRCRPTRSQRARRVRPARSSSTGRRPTSMDEVTTPFATRSHLITLLNRCRRESIRPGVPDGHLRCPLGLTAAIGAAVPARRDSAAAPTTPPTHVHRPKASWPKTTANPAASSISANQTTYR